MLSEPSVVALDVKGDAVVAVGSEAKRMIADFEVTEKMGALDEETAKMGNAAYKALSRARSSRRTSVGSTPRTPLKPSTRNRTYTTECTSLHCY